MQLQQPMTSLLTASKTDMQLATTCASGSCCSMVFRSSSIPALIRHVPTQPYRQCAHKQAADSKLVEVMCHGKQSVQLL